MGKTKSIYNVQYRQIIKALGKERRRLNISQSDLAKALDINQSDISKIEKLERRLDILEFAKILEIFRVSENQELLALVTSFLSLGVEQE